MHEYWRDGGSSALSLESNKRCEYHISLSVLGKRTSKPTQATLARVMFRDDIEVAHISLNQLVHINHTSSISSNCALIFILKCM